MLWVRCLSLLLLSVHCGHTFFTSIANKTVSVLTDYLDQISEVLNVECSADKFRCRNNLQCLPRRFKCDGVQQCADGSDEHECYIQQHEADALHFRTREFLTLFLDLDGEKFTCAHGTQQISIQLKCDGSIDCADGSDEKNCPHSDRCNPTEFHCKSDGQCIPLNWRCDGSADCSDSSDEQGCGEVKCDPGQFRCHNNITCINEDAVCNGIYDCTHGDDEDETTCRERAVHPCGGNHDQFHCGDNRCIDYDHVCNGVPNCEGGADEKNCAAAGCVSNPCHPSMTCMPMPEGEYRCACPTGLENTGHQCHDVNECANLTSNECSQQCINIHASYRCNCTDDYTLEHDGHRCSVRGDDPALMFVDGGTIRRISLRTLSEDMIARNLNEPHAVVFDGHHKQLIWNSNSKVDKKIVRRSLTPGANTTHPVTPNESVSTEQLALDWTQGIVYAVASSPPSIIACGVFQSVAGCTTVVHLDGFPRGLALHVQMGLMFHTNWRPDHKGIYVSGMDGSNMRNMISEDISWPNGIAVDTTQNVIYWTDADIGRVERAMLDGSQRQILIENVENAYAIAVFESFVYYSSGGNLYRADKRNGGDHHSLIKTTKMIMSLNIVHPSNEPAYSGPCSSAPCTQFCLPSSESSYTCACEAGFQLKDKHQCVNESAHNLSPTPATCDPDWDFPCLDGGCVASVQRCNGNDDCSDGSDEANCPTTPRAPRTDDCSSSPCTDIERCFVDPHKSGGYRCECQRGTRRDTNGACKNINECAMSDHDCSQKCEDVENEGYRCSCYDGYFVSPFNPSECLANGPSPIMFYGQQESIWRMYLHAGRGENNVVRRFHHGEMLPLALAYDGQEELLYWCQVSTVLTPDDEKLLELDGTIVVGPLNELDRYQKIFLKLHSEGLALDFLNRLLYATDYLHSRIVACELFSSHEFWHTDHEPRCTTVYESKKASKMRGLAVHPYLGKMFWADWAKDTPGIFSAGMDGSDVTRIVGDGLERPNTVAIDFVKDHLYFGDSRLDIIERVSFNGSNRETAVRDVGHPYSLAVFESSLYWSDWHFNAIERADKRMGANREQYDLQNPDHTPFGITLYHPVMLKRPSDDWFTQNHGVTYPSIQPCLSMSCPSMCLLGPQATATCKTAEIHHHSQWILPLVAFFMLLLALAGVIYWIVRRKLDGFYKPAAMLLSQPRVLFRRRLQSDHHRMLPNERCILASVERCEAQRCENPLYEEPPVPSTPLAPARTSYSNLSANFGQFYQTQTHQLGYENPVFVEKA